MAVFSSPVAAVRAAMQVQQQIDAHNQDQPQADQLYTRIGLNFGRGFVKNKDVFGDVVNTAARIVKACAPAQILFSRSVYEALQKEKGFKYRKLRSAAFHGKAAPEALYEVLWTSPQRYQQLRRQFDHTEDGKTTRNLLGRYEILQELGRGAMGVIYKAYDPTVGRIVALKTVRLDVTDSDREELVQRLRQEAQAIGRLEHPNILIGLAEPLLYFPLFPGAASGLRPRTGGRWGSRLGGFGLRFLRRRYLCGGGRFSYTFRRCGGFYFFGSVFFPRCLLFPRSVLFPRSSFFGGGILRLRLSGSLILLDRRWKSQRGQSVRIESGNNRGKLLGLAYEHSEGVKGFG